MYGGMYQDTTYTVDLPGFNTIETLCPSLSMPLNQVIHNTFPCNLEIETSGVYEVQYKLSFIPTIPALSSNEMEIELMVNGTPAFTEEQRPVGIAQSNIFQSMIMHLDAGDQVSLGVSSVEAITLTFMNGVNTLMTVKLMEPDADDT